MSKVLNPNKLIRKEENNFLNRKVGRLTPIEYLGKWWWRCKCDCGKEVLTRTDKLKNGKNSCGCAKKELCLYNKRIYRRWESMRCKNLLSDEFKDFYKFNDYIYNEIKPENKKYFRIYRTDLSKMFERGNIYTKTEQHEKEFYGKLYRWCTKCEKYIALSQNLWGNSKTKDFCKQCKYFNGLFGIGVDRHVYKNMIKFCNNKCEICNKNVSTSRVNKTACVDHCHKTNKVRGILCNNCNSGLGSFDDNIVFLKNAIKYLEMGDTEYKYHTWGKERNVKINKICPITGKKHNLVCDHNHETGFIRGNIYNYINLGMGSFKDSIEILENAIIYLEKSN